MNRVSPPGNVSTTRQALVESVTVSAVCVDPICPVSDETPTVVMIFARCSTDQRIVSPLEKWYRRRYLPFASGATVTVDFGGTCDVGAFAAGTLAAGCVSGCFTSS